MREIIRKIITVATNQNAMYLLVGPCRVFLFELLGECKETIFIFEEELWPHSGQKGSLGS